LLTPYCYYNTLTHRRNHLEEDIRPYTCVLSNCPNPDALYEDKRTWLDHMSSDHQGPSHWECILCPNGVKYATESDMAAHDLATHEGAINAASLRMFLKLCMRTIPQQITACPLCRWADEQDAPVSREKLVDHIAEHVWDFALRSLPSELDFDAGISESDGDDLSKLDENAEDDA
jgi:hypothetical protein